jgi:methylmalonyl-CoA/ethylmalonyl-CoA epimerase
LRVAGVSGIKHIAVAVKDADQALDRYQRMLGVGDDVRRYDLERAESREAHFFVGDVEIQLCQSKTPEGRFNDFIRQHGEGVHHICYTVDDVQQAVDNAVRNGATLKLCKSCQVVGVHEHPEGWIAFLESDAIPGMDVEFMQVYQEGEMPERFRQRVQRAV